MLRADSLLRDLVALRARNEDAVVDLRTKTRRFLRLRRKIESDPSRPQPIKTQRGAGYYLAAKVESPNDRMLPVLSRRGRATRAVH